MRVRGNGSLLSNSLLPPGLAPSPLLQNTLEDLPREGNAARARAGVEVSRSFPPTFPPAALAIAAATPTRMRGPLRGYIALLVALGAAALAGAHCPNRCRSVERSWSRPSAAPALPRPIPRPLGRVNDPAFPPPTNRARQRPWGVHRSEPAQVLLLRGLHWRRLLPACVPAAMRASSLPA